jgi:signal transduction histidine kinase
MKWSRKGGERFMSVRSSWKARRRVRTLSVIGLVALLIVELGSEARGAVTMNPSAAGVSFWVFHTAYALIAFLFLGVGSLVWLYGYRRQPEVSALLFVFCADMMVAFGTLSAPAVKNTFLTAVGSSCTALAVLFLLLLLLRFPVDLLARLNAAHGRSRWLRPSLAGLFLLCLLAVVRNVCFNYLNVAVPVWLTVLVQLYYALTSGVCVGTVIYSTRHAPSIRAQQQTRLFLAGTLLSVVPILVLTVIPALLHLRSAVDGTLSMLSLVFFPLSLGYAVLRYQILILDTYIRKTVTRIVGGVCLALLAYTLFAAGSMLVADRVALLLAGLIGVGVLGAPPLWWTAAWLTERYLFPEARYYARMLTQARHAQETFNLQLIAHQLALDTMMTLKAPGACLFFLDEDRQAYTAVAPYGEAGRQEQLRTLLLEPLEASLSLSDHDGGTAISVASPLVTLLMQARRPLFLREALPDEHAQRGGIARFLSPQTSDELEQNLLLAPINNLQSQLIGILVVGARGDHQHYAGPELEALQQLVHSSTAALETARQYELATRQQVRSTHELALALGQQRQLNAIKDELIVHMSHELRTPLTEVSGYLDLLGEQEGMLDASLQTIFVQKAQHGAQELMQLVDTILDAAQSGAAVAPPSCEVVSLSQVVREELDSLEQSVQTEHCIQRLLDDEILAWANAQSVHQVVRNLLSNALKYSPAQTTITVSVTADEEGAHLLVRDEGPGIPPEEMPLLFGKFVRLQRDISGAIRGTGLGLYICRQLVEAMGGQIWVESSGIAGQGSSFQVRLLAAPASSHVVEGGACDLAAV